MLQPVLAMASSGKVNASRLRSEPKNPLLALQTHQVEVVWWCHASVERLSPSWPLLEVSVADVGGSFQRTPPRPRTERRITP